jgi:hypothetical protein
MILIRRTSFAPLTLRGPPREVAVNQLVGSGKNPGQRRVGGAANGRRPWEVGERAMPVSEGGAMLFGVALPRVSGCEGPSKDEHHERWRAHMAELGCTHDDSTDGAGNFLSYTDASADFGDGAVMVSCPCSGWLVEDAHGRVLATSFELITEPAVLAKAA